MQEADQLILSMLRIAPSNSSEPTYKLLLLSYKLLNVKFQIVFSFLNIFDKFASVCEVFAQFCSSLQVHGARAVRAARPRILHQHLRQDHEDQPEDDPPLGE